jgi:hypothetical protein
MVSNCMCRMDLQISPHGLTLPRPAYIAIAPLYIEGIVSDTESRIMSSHVCACEVEWPSEGVDSRYLSIRDPDGPSFQIASSTQKFPEACNPIPTTPLPMSTTICRTLRPARQCLYQQRLQRCSSESYQFLRNDNLKPRNRPQNPFNIQQCRNATSMVRRARPTQKQPPQPSSRILQQNMQQKLMDSGEIPDDVGILPGTFIMPVGKNRPSWISNRKDRWKLERMRLWTRMSELWA